MTQPCSFWTRYVALVFSLKTFAAAMLAFNIALLLDMPRPYWAMTSVYVTTSVLTGATSSKAVYRILGTLIGAAGAIVLVLNLVDAPELLSLATALWVGAFLYLALLDGTPRSYVFMLAGYTVAIVGFPVLSTPELTFDVAVSVCRKSCWESYVRASSRCSCCLGASPQPSRVRRTRGLPMRAGSA